MSRTSRRTSTLFISLLFGLLAAFPAFAQEYPAGGSIECDSSAVAPGDVLSCSIDGCQPDTTATGEAIFNTDDGDETVTDTDMVENSGEATLNFRVPDDASGSVEVTLTCTTPDGQTQVLNNENAATVQPAASPSPTASPTASPTSSPTSSPTASPTAIAQPPAPGGGGGVLSQTGGPFQAIAIAAAGLLAAGAAFLVVGGRRRGNA